MLRIANTEVLWIPFLGGVFFTILPYFTVSRDEIWGLNVILSVCVMLQIQGHSCFITAEIFRVHLHL